ncbi:pirin family protein [Pseudactinotalea terrae]|uniref:pirin family protein n=1 Tax=Pseudactinotalea terrae TaxID=1743262 RepID=UPI0012E292AD|nr:pirin family protein [Pseudactinotalea terrae]
MTNLDPRPAEMDLEVPTACGPTVQLLEAREVPLGGIRAMTVRRTLPQRARSTVGAWCFLDAFGPSSDEPMTVLPHPHIGLQTVTWPMIGEIRHRDSLGSDLLVRPGELNLMTAGTGISHSEVSAEGAELMGLQLWAALPDGVDQPAFEHVGDLPRLVGERWSGIVLVGQVGEVRSPATVHTPMLGVDLTAEPGARVDLPLAEGFEHALLVVEGEAEVDGVAIPAGPLAFLGMAREQVSIAVGQPGARMVLLGGVPFEEPIVMFWNFVGRDHEQVAQARADWEADATMAPADPRRRFGTVAGHGQDRIPAPVVPDVRLKPRLPPTAP